MTFIIIPLLFFSCKNAIKYSKEKRVNSYLVLQVLEDNIRSNILDTLKQEITTYFGFKVIIYDRVFIPAAFKNYEKGLRYSADSIINYLNKIKPDSVAIIAGITEQDIYTTKKDENGRIKAPESKYAVWGIFGLGYMPGTSNIISLRRLHNIDESIYHARIIKIMLHEIGHNLGLAHCSNKKCFMTDAVESIATIDNESLNLCSKCKDKID